MTRALILLTISLTLSCKPSRPVGVVEAAETPPPAPATKAEPTPEPAGPPAFAGDGASKVFARILPPAEPPKLAATEAARPLGRPRLTSLEKPEVPLSAPLTTPISVPAGKKREPRPSAPPENAPLGDYTAEPIPPERLELPNVERIRTPSRDVHLPVELPAQARYRADRATLDDPTDEYSLNRAQAAPAPLRDKAAPFVRVNLPDPFENRVEVSSTLPEPPVVAPVPQAPK